jgi:hypothetical protein
MIIQNVSFRTFYAVIIIRTKTAAATLITYI